MNFKLTVLFAAAWTSLISLPATAVSTTWTTTGALNTGREYPTINLLNNGQVLVVGGANFNSLSSAELYNPATGLWTYTGSLPGATEFQTATLLPNGQVLVAGGLTSSNRAGAAELYNPNTGVWTATGSLHDARAYHTATLLNNGTVLVAGGEDSSGDTASAEIYNPATGAWTYTGSLNIARTGHTATLLSNGQVLVAGGTIGVDTAISSAELYNPSTGVWTLTGAMSQTRAGHTATLLANGQVLVAGGGNFATTGPGSSQLYTVSTGKWTNTGEMVTPRNSHTATLLQNGKVLVAGGIDYTNTFLSSAELFNPATATWATTTSLSEEHYSHGATLLLNGLALVTGGGFVNSGYSTDTELYNSGETPQTITFNAIGNQTNPSASFALVATASSGLPVTFSVISGPATISGSTITLTGSGTVVVQASQSGNTTYLADTSPPQSFTVSQATQTINFPAISSQTFEVGTVSLMATASSGLAVSYSVVSGPATVSGSIVTFTGIGQVTIQASQAGNANYLAAASVQQSFTISQGNQTIAFPAIANRPYPDPSSPFTLNATASSGLPVSYSYVSGPATLSGTNNNTVTVTGLGTVVIQASQAGSANYLAAPSVNQSLVVSSPVGFSGNPAATPQNDGVSNLYKYLYDINPTQPMSAADRAALPTVGMASSGNTSYLALTYRQYALETGITMNVQTSSDLQTWTTVNPPEFSQQVGVDMSTGDPIMEIGVKATGAATQFIRLNVSSP
jgi:N-acetylneuraminic acid mutarotase